MPQTARSEHDIRTVADLQRGLVTAAQLRAIGVPPGTTAYRSRHGGMWSRILPGVHLVTGGTPDRAQRELAAVLYAGPSSVLTGLTALRHRGVRANRLQELADDRGLPEPVFVLIDHSQRRLSTSFVQVERTRALPTRESIDVVDGLPLASPARAVADAARRLRRETDVTALVLDTVRRRLVTLAGLEAELERGSIRGSAHLRAAIAHAGSGVWSPAEGDLRSVLLTTGLPEPSWNVALVTLGGSFVAIPDAWFDDVGLALEVDSEEHHADGDAWRRTLARQRRYAEVGVTSLPITPAELRGSPTEVGESIVRAYRSAASKPRPPVRMSPMHVVPSPHDVRRWGG